MAPSRLLALVCATSLLVARAAAAQTAVAPDPEAERAVRFERTLAVHAESSRHARYVAGASVIAVGLGGGAVGFAGLHTADSHGIEYLALGVGVGFASLAVIPFMMRLPMESIRASYDAERRAGVSPALAMQHAESIWRTSAEREHNGRRSVGTELIGLGGFFLVAAPVGAALGNESDAWPFEVAFGAIGAAALGMGISYLTSSGTVEESWRLWQAGQSRPASAGLRVGLPSLAVTAHGASLVVGGAF